MQMDVAVWFVENWLVIAVIGLVIGAVAWIISWVTKASQANKSEISLGNDFVTGAGFVGDVSLNVASLYMEDKASFMQFTLPYEKITSVSTEGEYLNIIAGSAKYMIKTQNPAPLAMQIQNTMLQQKQNTQLPNQ